MPYKVRGIDLQTDNDGSYRAELRTDTQPADRVLRITVTDPEGNQRREYTKNVLAGAGEYSDRIPFAANDPAGTWKLTVRDVLSGAAAGASIRRPEQTR